MTATFQVLPGTKNGIENTSTYKTRPSQSVTLISTTSTVRGQLVRLTFINNAPIYKTVPVSFYENSTTLIGTADFSSNLTATLYTTNISTGTTLIKAVWPGQGRYKGTISFSTQTITVAPGYILGANIGITSSSIPAITGTNITFTFTATTSTNMAGTTITLLKDNQFAADAVFNAYNTATVSISFAEAGTYAMKGNWNGGNINGQIYEGQLSNVIFQDVVNSIQPIITFTSTNIWGVYGKGGTISAVLGNMGGFIDPTGTNITIYDNGQAILTSATTNNILSLPISSLSTGTHALTAEFTGNSRFLNAQTTGSFIQNIVSATNLVLELRSSPGMPYSSFQGTGQKITFLAITNQNNTTSQVTFLPDQTVPQKTKNLQNNIAFVEYSLDSANPESNGQILPNQFYGTTAQTGKAQATATIGGVFRTAQTNFDVSKIYTSDAQGRMLIGTVSGVSGLAGGGVGIYCDALRSSNPSWNNFSLRFECVEDGHIVTIPSTSMQKQQAGVTTDILYDSQPDTSDNGWYLPGNQVSTTNHPGTYKVYLVAIANEQYRISRLYLYKTG